MEQTVSFPLDLTVTLTGVTRWQLSHWRKTGLLVPEVQAYRPPLYSFRDLVALRTVAKLRAETSLQKVCRAFKNLSEFDLTEHPSAYRFATDGKTIAVWTDNGFMDIVRNPGQYHIYLLEDIFRPFVNKRGQKVADFEAPRPRISVDPHRLGGWPTIAGTRVPYDTVASALRGGDLNPKDLRFYYPGVSKAAAKDALDFANEVAERGGKRLAPSLMPVCTGSATERKNTMACSAS
ncbi:DUF433 domain-containing protein [Mycobacterium heidelbergense]|uniref:HTH merR-type domain-containing protein n=1 Tax=Mycobacterium heidelbergense TaxID=53376 RepID=A0A1X0DMM1_MYCHE|nr:DUF433 domain-containing protein [Mycobacterium heidelbergense]ORA73654.1 hypothetical protein BST25_11535 [Mycobacterium heidelbergense]